MHSALPEPRSETQVWRSSDCGSTPFGEVHWPAWERLTPCTLRHQPPAAANGMPRTRPEKLNPSTGTECCEAETILRISGIVLGVCLWGRDADESPASALTPWQADSSESLLDA